MTDPRPVALVTGASAGLGEVFARRLGARGHDLVLVARRADRLEALAAGIRQAHGGQALVLAVDLQRPDGPAEVAKRVAETSLPVDVLVNNAGYGNYGLFAECAIEREIGQIDLNVRSLVALTRLFLPAMLQRRRGTVINLGSVASFVPLPYLATYAATKAFVLSFTEALSAELDDTGVHAMIVCPGPTSTEFQEASGLGQGDAHTVRMTAEEVVDLALRDWDKRRRVSVTGFKNKLQTTLSGWFPRGFVARVTKRMFAKRKP